MAVKSIFASWNDRRPLSSKTSLSASASIAAPSRRACDQEHHNMRAGVLPLDDGLLLFDWKTILEPI
jgi:hypothetical protein